MQHYSSNTAWVKAHPCCTLRCLGFTRFVPVAAASVQSVFLFVLNQAPSPQHRETVSTALSLTENYLVTLQTHFS